MVSIVRRGGRLAAVRPSEAISLAEYLGAAVPVFVAASKQADTRDPSKGLVVPIGLVTDGTVVWPMEDQYYFTNYGGEVDARILESARRNHFRVPDIDSVSMQSIRAQVGEESRLSRDAAPAPKGGINPFG